MKPGGGVGGGGGIQEGHLFDIMAHKGGHLFCSHVNIKVLYMIQA